MDDKDFTFSCLMCSSKNVESSFFPDAHFNNKIFRYLKCHDCNLVFVSPLPDADDLDAMYPTTYQGQIDKNIYQKKLPGLRFSYSEQFNLINKFTKQISRRIADFGCGNGNFIINSMNRGILCDGVEYNPNQVKYLNERLEGTNVFDLNTFFESDIKYDLIRLSNVLEHLTNPNEMLLKIVGKLNVDGLVMIEGPIEINKSSSYYFRRLYYGLRRLLNSKYHVSHKPTHIFLTDHQNQMRMLEMAGLKTDFFKIDENPWPLPASFSEATGLLGKLKWAFFKIVSLNKYWIRDFGNTFIYIGSAVKLN